MEYYAPKARHECDNVEALSWTRVQNLFADNTERWAIPREHPNTGKFAVILPLGWRGIMPAAHVADIETSIMTWQEMQNAGWFENNSSPP